MVKAVLSDRDPGNVDINSLHHPIADPLSGFSQGEVYQSNFSAFPFFSKGYIPKQSLTPRTLNMGGGTPALLIDQPASCSRKTIASCTVVKVILL